MPESIFGRDMNPEGVIFSRPCRACPAKLPNFCIVELRRLVLRRGKAEAAEEGGHPRTADKKQWMR